jgi:hypothetical protein
MPITMAHPWAGLCLALSMDGIAGPAIMPPRLKRCSKPAPDFLNVWAALRPSGESSEVTDYSWGVNSGSEIGRAQLLFRFKAFGIGLMVLDAKYGLSPMLRPG